MAAGEDYKKFLDPSIISKLSSIDLSAKYIVEGFLLGLHKSPYHGFSIEFSEHRPYMQGDAIKDIDWKVYGKTDRFFVKQYEEETNLRCYIMLDCSLSMKYSSGKHINKFSYGSFLAAALSFLMIKQKDAVGLVLYDEKVNEFIPSRASDLNLKQILIALNNASPSAATNTSASLKSIAENIKRRGMVIIISDFFDDLNSTLEAIKRFRYQKNEVIIFQLLDPLERSFGFGRDSIFIDLETKEEMTTQPLQIQASYKEAMDTFIHKLKDECGKVGIDYNLLDTSQQFDKALYAYLQKRSKLN